MRGGSLIDYLNSHFAPWSKGDDIALSRRGCRVQVPQGWFKLYKYLKFVCGTSRHMANISIKFNDYFVDFRKRVLRKGQKQRKRLLRLLRGKNNQVAPIAHKSLEFCEKGYRFSIFAFHICGVIWRNNRIFQGKYWKLLLRQKENNKEMVLVIQLWLATGCLAWYYVC